MSRRKIVVEGTTYTWSYSYPYFHVHPPRGLKGSGANLKVFVGHCDEEGFGPVVTPRMVAEAIHRRILGREPPERPFRPIRTRPEIRRPETPPAWRTDPRLPETYLVSVRYERMGGTIGTVPLETHSDPTTAKACAERLDALIVRSGGRDWPPRKLLPHATREDVQAGVDGAHLRVLEDILGNGGLSDVRVVATTLPNRAPVAAHRAA